MASVVPVAYQGNTSLAVADWLNKGDNAWQMVSATLVGLQSVPGLVILYMPLHCQLGIHGTVCLCSGVDMLGELGIQDVLW